MEPRLAGATAPAGAASRVTSAASEVASGFGSGLCRSNVGLGSPPGFTFGLATGQVWPKRVSLWGESRWSSVVSRWPDRVAGCPTWCSLAKSTSVRGGRLILQRRHGIGTHGRRFVSAGRVALYIISLGAKRLHDVDTRGAHGGYRGRDDCGRQQHKCGNDYGEGAWHLHVEEIAACQTRHHEPECRACKDAGGRHHDTFSDDAAQEITRLRSQRQPDTEFARPRADRKRQHSCDANQGNR